MSTVRSTTEGARRLREYLVGTGKTLHAFCEEHDLDYSQVHRALSGARGRRVSVDFAKAIRLATDGAVPTETWSSDTLQQPAA